MSSVEIYQQHLNKVSRSFAFCIARLDLPLKAWVGLTYLLCRILDTIEDASWDSLQSQQKQFEAFDRFLSEPASAAQIKEWRERFPRCLPEGELELIQDSRRIFEDLNDLEQDGRAHSGTIRKIIQQLGKTMSAGMQHFSKQKQGGEMKLRSLAEVNQYCFFVAGLVGEALARLLAQVEPAFRLVEQRIFEAHHFGLFLQKVNILKDQLGDESEGRFLVPNRAAVLESARINAEGAFRFLNNLPANQKSFRLFCAWSLFLGLGTLTVSEKAFRKGQSAKLDRKDADRLLTEVEKRIDDPAGLEEIFLELGRRAGMSFENWKIEASPRSASPATDSPWPESNRWLKDIYEGDLAEANLKALGLIEAS